MFQWSEDATLASKVLSMNTADVHQVWSESMPGMKEFIDIMNDILLDHFKEQKPLRRPSSTFSNVSIPSWAYFWPNCLFASGIYGAEGQREYVGDPAQYSCHSATGIGVLTGACEGIRHRQGIQDHPANQCRCCGQQEAPCSGIQDCCWSNE